MAADGETLTGIPMCHAGEWSHINNEEIPAVVAAAADEVAAGGVAGGETGTDGAGTGTLSGAGVIALTLTSSS